MYPSRPGLPLCVTGAWSAGVPGLSGGCDGDEGSTVGHTPHNDGLMGCGLGHSVVHGFKPGEVLKLHGEF